MKHNPYPIYFTFPALLLYVGLVILPGLAGVWYSFTDWNVVQPNPSFVGLENYIKILTSIDTYGRYIGNTVFFTIVANVVKLVPAFFIALALSGKMPGRNLYRAIVFFPAVLSFVVVGLIFRSMLHPTRGLVNEILNVIGAGSLAQRWLVDRFWVWPSIFAVDAWRGIGYAMTIFLAGIQTIPKDYYDAADIDGAGTLSRVVHIVIPLVVPSITINLIFGLAYGLKVFDLIYVLTGGGPARMTEVINTVVFREYGYGNYAIATTMSTVLMIVMTIVAFSVIGYLNKKQVDA
jgi:raffinose/stachyose/melibiose transport system permease protein